MSSGFSYHRLLVAVLEWNFRIITKIELLSFMIHTYRQNNGVAAEFPMGARLAHPIMGYLEEVSRFILECKNYKRFADYMNFE